MTIKKSFLDVLNSEVNDAVNDLLSFDVFDGEPKEPKTNANMGNDRTEGGSDDEDNDEDDSGARSKPPKPVKYLKQSKPVESKPDSDTTEEKG